VIHSIAAGEGVIIYTRYASGKLPVKDVSVIGNWIWCLSWGVVVVFATTLGHKLVLFPAWLCYGKGRASVHKSDLLYMKGVEVMWHKSERRDC